jgi:MYXO-CTERM domain-containing protein
VRTSLGSAFIALAMLVPCIDARADVITDEEAACRDKKAGDSCTAQGKAGSCVTKKCGRLDYSKGTPPTSKEVDCLWCVGDAKAETAPAPTPAKTDAKAVEPASDVKPSADTKPTAATDSKPSESKSESKSSDGKSGGCGSSIGGTPTSLASLLVGVGLLVAARRRTRSRR